MAEVLASKRFEGSVAQAFRTYRWASSLQGAANVLGMDLAKAPKVLSVAVGDLKWRLWRARPARWRGTTPLEFWRQHREEKGKTAGDRVQVQAGGFAARTKKREWYTLKSTRDKNQRVRYEVPHVGTKRYYEWLLASKRPELVFSGKDQKTIDSLEFWRQKCEDNGLLPKDDAGLEYGCWSKFLSFHLGVLVFQFFKDGVGILERVRNFGFFFDLGFEI